MSSRRRRKATVDAEDGAGVPDVAQEMAAAVADDEGQPQATGPTSPGQHARGRATTDSGGGKGGAETATGDVPGPGQRVFGEGWGFRGGGGAGRSLFCTSVVINKSVSLTCVPSTVESRRH